MAFVVGSFCLSTHSPAITEAASPLRIAPVPASDWPTALRLLFQSFPEAERESRMQGTLNAVAAGNLHLDGLRQAYLGDDIVGVSLTMSQPDGITLVWPPVTFGQQLCPRDHSDIFAALMHDVCQQLDAEGARLGQVLLDDSDELMADQLRSAGFAAETRLFFLARSLHEPLAEEASPPAWWSTPYSPETHDRFARLLERSYQQSLDCPLLEGIRTGDEAIASHRLAGQFDPSLWQIFTAHDPEAGTDVDVGLFLLNDHPDQDAVELTYFGVRPEYRGQRLGHTLLTTALEHAAARQRAALFLAVDAQNIYANSLYDELGFVELARRVALFRVPDRSARQSSTGN